ncbi:hypothetical protein C8R43DRAFT_1143123 [Mycena crocata]|nr:hypothetical protein C8R43DRAFT_1143123 [Mycena crocata]
MTIFAAESAQLPPRNRLISVPFFAAESAQLPPRNRIVSLLFFVGESAQIPPQRRLVSLLFFAAGSAQIPSRNRLISVPFFAAESAQLPPRSPVVSVPFFAAESAQIPPRSRIVSLLFFVGESAQIPPRRRLVSLLFFAAGSAQIPSRNRLISVPFFAAESAQLPPRSPVVSVPFFAAESAQIPPRSRIVSLLFFVGESAALFRGRIRFPFSFSRPDPHPIAKSSDFSALFRGRIRPAPTAKSCRFRSLFRGRIRMPDESLQPAAAADILILFFDTRRPHQGLPLICRAHQYLQEQGLGQRFLIVAAYTQFWSQIPRHEGILAGHVAHQVGALLITHALVNAAPFKSFLLQTIVSSCLMSEAHADHSLNHHVEALSATLPSHPSTQPMFTYCWCLGPQCRPTCANTELWYVPYIRGPRDWGIRTEEAAVECHLLTVLEETEK